MCQVPTMSPPHAVMAAHPEPATPASPAAPAEAPPVSEPRDASELAPVFVARPPQAPATMMATIAAPGPPVRFGMLVP